MSNFKHLFLSERLSIETGLKQSLSFKAIGRQLGRDCTSISKEVRNHKVFRNTGASGKVFNNCSLRFNCSHTQLCDTTSCNKRYCKTCTRCTSVCPDYTRELCPDLSKPPYVCNGCSRLKKCTLQKAFYNAKDAQNEYELYRSESRCGVSMSEEEISVLDHVITPLIQKGQSIHHICSKNADAIMCSEKTIYNYVDYNLFSARNLDLPRKVKYRPRKKNKNFKVDKSCRIGRTYTDFLDFMKDHPDTPVVEMDSVEGVKGGKVLLTIHFKNAQLMLAFLRDANNSQSVINVFEDLYLTLLPDSFMKLFPVILTDNGSEFSNPSAIEFDKQGNRRTYIFYCDPSAPYQKGAVENNHELIRRIVPKGCSFNTYSQSDILLMMNNINSYGRKKLNDRSPYDIFRFLHGIDALKKLGLEYIKPNDIILSPKLLTK